MGDGLDRWRTQLTDVQVNCLRLVAEGYTSKEIAKQLGLTPMTVDQYLHRAKKAVGAPDRRAASRRFFEQQADPLFKSFELKTPAVADSTQGMTPPRAPGGEPVHESTGHSCHPLMANYRNILCRQTRRRGG